MPSLVYTLCRCHSTVRTLRNSWAPISDSMSWAVRSWVQASSRRFSRCSHPPAAGRRSARARSAARHAAEPGEKARDRVAARTADAARRTLVPPLPRPPSSVPPADQPTIPSRSQAAPSYPPRLRPGPRARRGARRDVGKQPVQAAALFAPVVKRRVLSGTGRTRRPRNGRHSSPSCRAPRHPGGEPASRRPADRTGHRPRKPRSWIFHTRGVKACHRVRAAGH